MMDLQTIYQKAIKFAGAKHAVNNQCIPGTNLPYIIHLSNVAMEILTSDQSAGDFKLDFALQLALLHDILEDTDTTFDEISREFGFDVAEGVAALTKNENLPKPERMADSLKRIRLLSKEVSAVKLADRITNLQEPPEHWDKPKKENYLQEARLILDVLKGQNKYLEARLEYKIKAYENFMGNP